MLRPFEDIFQRLQALHDHMLRALEGLSQEALDWSPGPEMNSLAVLAAHTAGSIRYWIGDVAGQDPSGRVRQTEFETTNLDREALVMRLNAALAHSRGVLEKLALADLEARRATPPYGGQRANEEYTVAWALAHALEHTGIHVGQMQLTRQLWDQRQAASDKAGGHMP